MTRDDTWLTGWLGDTDVTDEQRAALLAAAARIEARWPDPDAEDARRDALNGAAQVILGDTSLEDVARAWQRARRAERDAMAVLTGALIADDAIEADVVRRTGLARMTVRKARGL